MSENSRAEGLTKQFRRTVSRLKRAWKGEAVQLDDINVIKLPASYKGYAFGDEYSYFASRTAAGTWNIDAQKNWGGEYLETRNVASSLDLPAALNLLAKANPASMQRETNKYWHPAYVAGLIGHTFPAAEAPAAAPKTVNAGL